MTAAGFARRHPDIPPAEEPVRVLRSVLMKPEHEDHAAALVERLSAMVG